MPTTADALFFRNTRTSPLVIDGRRSADWHILRKTIGFRCSEEFQARKLAFLDLRVANVNPRLLAGCGEHPQNRVERAFLWLL